MGRYWVAILAVFALAFLPACTQQQSPSPSAVAPAVAPVVEASQTATPPADPDPHSDLKLGQPARYDDGFEVTVLEAKRGPKDYEGYDTALLKVRYVNKTPNQLRAGFDDWYIEAGDGTRYDTGGNSVGFSNDDPQTLSFEDVAPGRTYVGLEAIRLPRDVKPARVGFSESTQTYRVSDWKVSF